MTQISVFEILSSQNAMFYQGGLKLKTSILQALKKEDVVEISFAKIRTLTSQFLYASFEQIIAEKGINYFNARIRVNHTDHISTYHIKIRTILEKRDNFSVSQKKTENIFA